MCGLPEEDTEPASQDSMLLLESDLEESSSDCYIPERNLSVDDTVSSSKGGKSKQDQDGSESKQDKDGGER